MDLIFCTLYAWLHSGTVSNSFWLVTEHSGHTNA
jgi:hypothetical protein